MDLKNLSVEELENLRSEIDSLIKEKFVLKYNVGDCFISFDTYHDLCIIKITNIYKHYYKCTCIFNCFRNDFGIGKKDLKDRDLDSYIKIESSLYDSIESFIQKYIQRKDVDYKQLGDKYHKEITDYIENLKIKFQND